MGLLDDAIREHLDLKRQHGADPAEVERAEREALGPVRRGIEPQDQADPGDEHELLPEDEEPLDDEHALPYDDEEAEDWEELEPAEGEGIRFEEQPLELDDEPALEEPLEPPAETSPPPAPVDPAEPAGATPMPHPAPAGKDEELHRQPHSDPGEETAEYEVEDALAEEHGAEREDVLEETPEFLQDTPDHDRLWFEQRPPRDFDFDG